MKLLLFLFFFLPTQQVETEASMEGKEILRLNTSETKSQGHHISPTIKKRKEWWKKNWERVINEPVIIFKKKVSFWARVIGISCLGSWFLFRELAKEPHPPNSGEAFFEELLEYLTVGLFYLFLVLGIIFGILLISKWMKYIRSNKWSRVCIDDKIK